MPRMSLAHVPLKPKLKNLIDLFTVHVREAWVSGSQLVAKRVEISHSGASRGARGARWFRGFRGRQRARGGRFHWKIFR